MLNSIGVSLSDLAGSDVEEDWADEDDEDEVPTGGKLGEDKEPGWAMGTISEMVQYRMEHLRQKQMKLDKLTQPGSGDSANYFGEEEKKYRTTEWKVPDVV